MRRKSEVPLQKVTLNLFEGDFSRLQDLHPDLGAGAVIRLIVRRHLDAVKDHSSNRRESVPISLEQTRLA
jgi:hypothetical protein